MLAAVQSSRRFLIVPRNCPAIIPSMIRGSKLRHIFIISGPAVPSPITTGRLTIDSVVRIAACGWLMMGWLATEPVGPGVFGVEVAPWHVVGFDGLVEWAGE